jgi:hypothetical protein
MPAYVPPYLRKAKFKSKSPKATRKVRFVGNITGNANEAPDNGVRYSPRHNAIATRKILKHVAPKSKSAEPPAKPTTALYHMPPAFRNEIFRRRPYLLTKKHKKVKKLVKN